MNRFLSIAIDGTAASGKTTTASALSQKYHYLMVSTGGHYRAITRYFLDHGMKATDVEQAQNFPPLSLSTVISPEGVASLTIEGNIYPAEDLRSAEVNHYVSYFAAIPAVRSLLFHYQRSQVDLAKEKGFNGIVMEGRDITSVILPDADLKFFLEASERVRLLRRQQEKESDDLQQRDQLDQSRTIFDPHTVLKINTENLSLDQVVTIISEAIDCLQ